MWEGRRTCGKAGGHVGRWEDMWEGGRTCGKAGGHVGRREDRWEGGRTCGKAGGHVGRREDMWEGGRTCGKAGGTFIPGTCIPNNNEVPICKKWLSGFVQSNTRLSADPNLPPQLR